MPHVSAAETPTAMSWFPEEMVEPRALPTGEPVSPCRWLATEAAFADTGGLVSGDQLADLIRDQCQAQAVLQAMHPMALVARWIVQKRVVAIESPWGPMLPLFQFDVARGAIHPGVQLVLSELKGVLDDLELALWFVSPNEWLDGRKPAQGLQQGLTALQRAARTDRYVALGG